MWSILNGTLVNTATVALGSSIGLAASTRIPERYQRIILDALGLFTILLGLDASIGAMGKIVACYGAGIPTYGARVGMVAIGSLIVGAIIGTALRLHERLEGLGGVIHARFGGHRQGGRFAEGFLTASVIFCVGPLTLLGCLNNGTQGDPSLLYIKSFLDGFCSMALAASMGLGVLFSVLTVLLFQGGLALVAHYGASGLPELSIQLMNVVGGVILIATSLLLLEIKKIPAANLLPGVFLPPLVVMIVEAVSKGMLITVVP
ncbi:MAG: DUF554 domain-containing protein [Planctomycetota bacterium]